MFFFSLFSRILRIIGPMMWREVDDDDADFGVVDDVGRIVWAGAKAWVCGESERLAATRAALRLVVDSIVMMVLFFYCIAVS